MFIHALRILRGLGQSAFRPNLSMPSEAASDRVYTLGMITTGEKTHTVWKISIITNGTTVSFEVDTGAEVICLQQSTSATKTSCL